MTWEQEQGFSATSTAAAQTGILILSLTP